MYQRVVVYQGIHEIEVYQGGIDDIGDINAWMCIKCHGKRYQTYSTTKW